MDEFALDIKNLDIDLDAKISQFEVEFISGGVRMGSDSQCGGRAKLSGD